MSLLMWTTSGPVALSTSPEEAEAHKKNATTQLEELQRRAEQMREQLATAQANAARQMAELKKQAVESIQGLYAYLNAHAPEHPLLTNLIPQVRHAVDLYRDAAYQYAVLQATYVDNQITALHQLEPSIPLRT
jgi:vacuolar-type H+-ATPase subunit E/Vma4